MDNLHEPWLFGTVGEMYSITAKHFVQLVTIVNCRATLAVSNPSEYSSMLAR